jgi:hypothetical protein
MKKDDAVSKVKTNSLAKRMHDGYERQINRKIRDGYSSACHMDQSEWDRIFKKGEHEAHT